MGARVGSPGQIRIPKPLSMHVGGGVGCEVCCRGGVGCRVVVVELDAFGAEVGAEDGGMINPKGVGAMV